MDQAAAEGDGGHDQPAAPDEPAVASTKHRRVVVYADVEIGVSTVVDHHTLPRTAVRVGPDTQLGLPRTVERATRIGRDVHAERTVEM